MPQLMTMFSVMWPCQLLNQQRKVSVMERTLNLESGHLSVSLISTSSCFFDLANSFNFLPPAFPFNTYPTILKKWSLEHQCLGDHQRVAWVSPTSGFITHLLDEHFWDATSLSPACDQSKPRHKNSGDLWSAMSTIAGAEVLHRSNYILRNVP